LTHMGYRPLAPLRSRVLVVFGFAEHFSSPTRITCLAHGSVRVLACTRSPQTGVTPVEGT
jgi:hypothetical protein